MSVVSFSKYLVNLNKIYFFYKVKNYNLKYCHQATDLSYFLNICKFRDLF